MREKAKPKPLYGIDYDRENSVIIGERRVMIYKAVTGEIVDRNLTPREAIAQCEKLNAED